jgi:hypothetical protein
MSWQQEAKKIAAGKWIKFDSENIIHIVTFEGEPERKEKISTIKGKEGEKYYQMAFPVTEDGEDRILEPNASLLRQIIAEDEVESIMGRSIMIKLLDPQKKQNWMLRPVGEQKSVTRSWSGDEKKEPEAALQKRAAKATVKVEPKDPESLKPEFDDEGKVINAEPEDKEKAKFMANVEARAKKTGRKTKTTKKTEADNDSHRDKCDDSQTAEGEME